MAKDDDDRSIADQIVDGEVCEICTFPFKVDFGYPMTCIECGGKGRRAEEN